MNKIQIRISYADTDQMGMVYYANYLVFFERARTEWLRETGLVYKNMEANGLYFPVISAECKYYAPAKYDDIIEISTKLIEISAATLVFFYEIKLQDKVLSSGKTKHTLVNRDFKPVRFPKDIRQLLEKNLEPQKE
jgi:acyl-CoA thioester hydrolase